MTTLYCYRYRRRYGQTRIIRGGRYYCVTIPTLERLLRQAGFFNP